jgi:hypothetical protein
MRPKFSGVTSNSMMSPMAASGLMALASARLISRWGFSACSTTSF